MSHKRHRRTLQMEQLEQRQMMAADISQFGNQIIIHGTNLADDIAVTVDNSGTQYHVL